MKSMRVAIVIILYFLSFMSFGQIPVGANVIFYENFDSTQANWKMITYGFPANRPTPFFREISITKGLSSGAATDTVGDRTRAYLLTPILPVDSGESMVLSFDQICYIERFDDATVEYSLDKGVNWERIPKEDTVNGMVVPIYLGASIYRSPFGIEDKFSKLSQSLKWQSATSSYNWTGSNSANAWENEVFDITPLLIKNNYPDSIMFQLAIYDDISSYPGRVGKHQWYVDNFLIYEPSPLRISNEKMDLGQLKIFPNPAMSYLTIQNSLIENVDVRIYDYSGRLFHLSKLLGNQVFELDVSSFPTGIYIVEMNSKSITRSRKIIIQ